MSGKFLCYGTPIKGRIKKIVLGGMVFLILIFGLVGCQEPASEIGLSKGNIAPNFQLQNLNGEPINLWDLRGKVVLLSFWASWCQYSQLEILTMELIYPDYQDKGLEILAVDFEEDKEKVQDFLNSSPLGVGAFSFPVLLDLAGNVARDYQITEYPTSFLIDSQGRIKEVFIGYQPWSDSSSRQMIENLLTKK
jgi:peroxiredoxin